MARALEETRWDSIERFGTFAVVAASLDGSWMRRGYAALLGLVSCINIFTNKVIGFDVRSKYCPKCKGKEGICSEEECRMNHVGSSGSMEPVGAAAILRQIYEKYSMKLIYYLGDGDSKGFGQARAAAAAYGWDIQKLECINHVSKRIGKRLRNRVTEVKNLLVEGQTKKGIGGVGRLTGPNIDKIQRHYAGIIRSSNGDVQLMKKRVAAMYRHISSSDQHPDHDDCDLSCCRYLQAKERGEDYCHAAKFHLSPRIMEQVKDIFDDLGGEELLSKCAHGKTQNANEGFNAHVWHILPKSGFANRGLLELTVNMAICTYNEGQLPLLDVWSSLGLFVSAQMAERCKKIDLTRVTRKRAFQNKVFEGWKRRKAIVDTDGAYSAGLGD